MREQELFTTSEVSEITGLSVDALGGRARRGSIKSVRDEFGRIMIPIDEVRRLKAEFDDEDADLPLGNDPASISKAILEGDTALASERAEVVGLRSQNTELKRLLREMNRRETLNDRIVFEVSSFLEDYPYKPSLTIPKFESDGQGEYQMLLAVSDAHYPEVVNPEEALGVAYGPEIARARIEHLLDRTVRLIETRGGVEKITVAVLGDMLSGNIHEELEVTNAIPMGEALTDMVYMLYDFGSALTSCVSEVEMVVLPGNHPRMTKKPRNKQKFDNFEFIMGQFLKGIARDEFQVTVPKDIIYTHKVYDWHIGMTHGDGSKAAGFAGIPLYGINKRSNATQAMRANLGLERLNMLIMGHYHKMSFWTEGDCHIIINGAIKGGDEYSIVTRSSVSPAVQGLMTFHRDHGWISTERIELEHIV